MWLSSQASSCSGHPAEAPQATLFRRQVKGALKPSEHNLQRKLYVEGFACSDARSSVEIADGIEYPSEAARVELRAWRGRLRCAARSRNGQIVPIEEVEHLYPELC